MAWLRLRRGLDAAWPGREGNQVASTPCPSPVTSSINFTAPCPPVSWPFPSPLRGLALSVLLEGPFSVLLYHRYVAYPSPAVAAIVERGTAIRRPCSFPTLLASPFACRFVFDLHRKDMAHAPSTASSTASLQSQIPDVHAADLRILRPNRVVFGGSADQSYSICIYPFYIL